jgi:hypothetical protein
MLSTKADPVCRWQFKQWQQWTNIGKEVSRYRSSPQAQPPSSPDMQGLPLGFSFATEP